ncbi:MAG: potassium transporter TrkG [Eubacteriales bacterium]|nr:potassium transporter TrkG [Eubacteriales bacterium]MDD3866668.1 potassium transporter TrkG [Eubacteriales bacterium]MDD4462515.1 potassium transporter TrkG [Eubacteriales bacterium]
MAVKLKEKQNKVMRWIQAQPARIILVSFILVIAIGTLLLSLPFATVSGRSSGLLTALFTATSATCVTGLVIHDTAIYWSAFGKGTILALIQIGGLGLVTVTTFFYILLRRKASLRTMIVAQESVANFEFSDVLHLIRRIVLITFSVELAGAVLLAWRMVPVYGWRDGILKGIFQAVSAFCNAGFDPHGDVSGPFSSLTAWNDDPVLLLLTSLLIIIGGLGFVVWSDLISWPKQRQLNFHSRVVLIMTGLLITAGTVFFFLTEADNTSHLQAMGSLPAAQRPMAAFFQSVTTRTAGFNSIDQSSLTASSKFMSVMLMVIGAAPGSTGGGIKVTTFAVILATVISDMKRRQDIVIFRHRLAREIFTRAFAVMGLAMALILGGTLLLTITERAAVAAGQLRFLDLLFETVSAFATVGLSAAGTSNLQPASLVVLIPIMLIGRVGPAAFAISLAVGNDGRRDIVYPAGRTIVG